MPSPDPSIVVDLIADRWSDDIVPALEDYITIPALSPAFDADWRENGHLDRAVADVAAWLRGRPVAGLEVEVVELDGRTPLIVADIAPFGLDVSAEFADERVVVLYGHVDKQPEMTGWRDDLGPWTPVREGDRLYGRGGADDGYAAFAAITAIEAVQAAGLGHGRCVLLIEASEESGSPDLPAHLEALGDRLGQVDLVLCLDSGCATYDTLWLTTSLRGVVSASVTVEVVTEGVHSGSASGLVPSSFRVMRRLLDRIEDADTGRVLLESAHVEIPPYRVAEAEVMAARLGPPESFPVVDGLQLMMSDPAEAQLARTWRPALSVTGADGLPPTSKAGNVLRPSTSLKLSLRVPPEADADAVLAELTHVLTVDPPDGARVGVHEAEAADGWHAPALEPWLRDSLSEASQAHFSQDLQLMGEGGTIPFMGMLGERFPEAQFVIIGVLGPGSNAHGPNEFIDVAYAEKLTCCVADVLAGHGRVRLDRSEQQVDGA